MPSKYISTLELFEDTLKNISSPSRYMSFLDTAAHNYKYPFDDQLLIYAQKPEAVACADISTWNKLGRYVNRGTKGIALLVQNGTDTKLRHVFDISDTNSFYGNEVKLWEYDEVYEDQVLSSLENSFGEVGYPVDFEGGLIALSAQVVEDNYSDYLDELLNLGDVEDKETISTEFKDLLVRSVAFQTLSRCGYNAAQFFEEVDFENIAHFTGDRMAILGTASSDISEMMIREIELTVKSAVREEEQNRTFAQSVIVENNIGEEIDTERSDNDGTDLQTGGGLSSSEYIGTGEPADIEVRYDETEISETEPEGAVYRDEDIRQAERTSGDGGQRSDRDDGETGIPDGEGSGSGREDENDRPDEVGRSDEQHSGVGGGDSSERGSLPLSGHDFNRPTDVPYYYAPDDKNELIRNCDALRDHRKEIAAFFTAHTDRDERGSFVKSFFKDIYTEHILENGDRVGFKAYDDLLHIWHGSYLSRDKEDFVKWWGVADMIYGQMLLDKWLTPEEKELPTVDEQIESIKSSGGDNFYLPQAAIDYVLAGGSNFIEGKLRIYEQFSKHEPLERNVAFLKAEYGVGGHSDAIPGSGVWEEHDGKGIRLKSHGITFDLPWNKVAKRIGELIDEDKYLNDAEKERYPEYLKESADRKRRYEIANLFNSIVDDFNDYEEQIDNDIVIIDRYRSRDLSSLFGQGERVSQGFGSTSDILVLPAMRDILERIIAENTHLTDRAQEILDMLEEDVAKPFEPTYDELNPPPEPEKEYRLSLGDRVYIGVKEYEIVDLSDPVMLFDPKFPLLFEEMSKEEFDKRIKENPLNDKYAHYVETDEGEFEEAVPDADDIEAMRDIDAHEAEYGADGTRVFREVERSFPEENISEREFEILEKVLHDLKIDDIVLDYDSDGLVLVARDIDNEWRGAEFYRFLVDEAFVFEDDGSVLSIDDDLLNDFKTLAESYGVKLSVGKGIKPESPAVTETVESETVSEETLSAPPKTRKKRDLSPHILYPEIKSDYRSNFRIENDDIGVGTPLERFHHNIMAIQLLHKLEDEHRLADTNEQRILADYVGWGGLSDFFKENNYHYNEIRAVLNDEELASARESTLTAFYTPPVVIKAIYSALENMNFKNGNILEPSCGIGNFMGLIPDSMKDSKMYGVELDSITGRIAKQLYQKNSIAVQGYETTDLPDSFFDAALGNVPFGSFKVSDKRYDKNNFLIHDYFFAKTLDKVRPGGIIAFITSRGTMDKENSAVRKYIAQRADLIGAIRLPNNTFKDAAGTEVTADILFLQKRDRLIDIEPDWVRLGTDENGITVNRYFIDNPDMILGEMRLESGQFGMEPTCVPYEDQTLEEGLSEAIQNIHAQVTRYEYDDLVDSEEDLSIPADPSVRNFSYTVVDGKIYYRENSRMEQIEVSVTAHNRIRGMMQIRDTVRNLIEYQTEDYPDEDILAEQSKLNKQYDEFSRKYGLINSRANSSAFSSDSSYYLLCSLEILDDEGNFVRKADMFSKRTIRQKINVTSVDTPSEALALSLSEKTKVDMEYMCGLTGKTEEEIFSELKGVIFLNPAHTSDSDTVHPKYLPADEYLSGNIREKLEWAKRSADLYPSDYTINVEALERVMPKDLSASEISVRLGSTWLPVDDVNNFMWELFGTPWYQRRNICVHFSSYTGEWNVEGKSYDRGNIKVHNTYGTDRVNGYKILEETLNLRDVRVFDYIEDADGRRTPILNKKETAIAQGKQQLIKEAFLEWIWKDPERRERLCKLYNEKYNSTRPREYDGSHITFVGMNPEITLRPHQVNAIAHILYGGNTLLAHVVGAGKTYEMVAAAQESKRLGLCRKSLFVVPNHLTEQWASEYLQLYPSANILAATKKDFETKNRKKFCGRIATGDYDAIIIGHSQFEKIPMSVERQIALLRSEEEELLEGIQEMKRNRGDSFSIKQLEKARKSIRQKLEKLIDQSRKDDVVTFEELGVDRLFIDEAHYYKNLAAFTKMRNVGGISQTEAMKSSDLFMKCRYLDEITGGRGVIFATGTPISNSMVEMYTMQKYLQYGTLQRNDIVHFDSWASTFGETVTAIELAPEGNGYRAKTRFAKFYNLPELMSMFKMVADVQTADMLNLPVPKANYHNVVLKPSETQKEMVQGLSERAEKVRNKMVNSSEDNMLCITNDGRKLALDQRLLNEMLPDSETGKVSACADNVFDIWQKTTSDRSAQLVFCDLSTPKGDGHFNVYDDLKAKLVAKGIPPEEIAFIHSANTEAQKKEMFGKVRTGQIRVLIGSTQKMGAGTNVQKKLIALHHLDCPWRPADLQQREGRIIRQGNDNPEVDIFTYVTENTFDSYLYQLVESKQKFIGQIMTSKSPVRSAEDVDEQALSYAEIKALCTGNPHIKEKMDLDIDVSRLKLLKANHLSQRYALEDKILKEIPQKIASLEQRIEGYKEDISHAEECTHPNEDGFSPMVLQGEEFTDKKAAGSEILAVCKSMKGPDPIPLGTYRGFEMELFFDTMAREYMITLKHSLRHTTALGSDIFGNIQRLDNLISGFGDKLKACEAQLENEKVQLETAKQDVDKPFAHEEELKVKSARLAELNAMLDLNKRDNEIVDDEKDTDDGPEKEKDGREVR